MQSTTVARSLRGSIGMLAMPWLINDDTITKAANRGLRAPGLGAYAVGRLGVLGDCPVDNVVGAAFFWEPNTMRQMVHDGRSAMSPLAGAAVYTEICQEWGAEHLAQMPGIERLGDILSKVVDNADPRGAPLFVGWRDMPLPTKPGPARTFQLAQVMRELRFSRHVVAVQAASMSPLAAIMTGPTGEWNARLFGWAEPFPDVSSQAEQREAIETHTDQLQALDLDLLSDEERQELRTLAKAARVYASEHPS